MHAPDGFVNAATALGTGALSVGALSGSLRATSNRLRDSQVPMAGLTAAFVFAAQMLNFPVGAGTSGHLIGGALAAILVGPHLGALVVTVVVVIQAVLLSDGGLTALGLNVLNMAVVPAYGGYAIFWVVRRLLPRSGAAVVAATFLGAMSSVVLSAVAFAVQFALGGTAQGVDPVAVLYAMVGVHVLIGIGEGLISAATIGTVLGVRPDLVHGARDLDAAQSARTSMRHLRPFLAGGLLVTVLLAVGVSQVASGDPDGLERVAQDQGFDATGRDSAVADSPFADYGFSGVDDDAVGLGIAGLVGVGLTFAAGVGLVALVRRRGDDEVDRIDLTADPDDVPAGGRRPTTGRPVDAVSARHDHGDAP